MITVYLACGGLIFTALLGFVLFIAHYLTFSGYLAFIFLGTFLAALTPPFVWLLLGLFFGSAIFIHAIKKVASNQFDTIGKKGAQRDAKQLLANSLPVLVAGLLAQFFPATFNWSEIMTALIAVSSADTWASEIGMLAKGDPYNILTLKKVATGLSGGVSLLGTFAAIGGSFLIAATYAGGIFLFTPISFQPATFWQPFLLGVLGMFVDSLLGSALQSKYRCVVCHQITEQEYHHNKPCQLVHGLKFIDNDIVNLLTGFTVLVITLFI